MTIAVEPQKNAPVERQLGEGNNPHPREEKAIDMPTLPQSPDTHTADTKLPAWAETVEDVDGLTVTRSKRFYCSDAEGYINQRLSKPYDDPEPFLIARVEGGPNVEGYLSDIVSLIAVLRDMVAAAAPLLEFPPLSLERFATIVDELGVDGGDLWNIMRGGRK